MATTPQKETFKFIHGITSSDNVIGSGTNALIAAYIKNDGNSAVIDDPLGLTNSSGFQEKMVAASNNNREATIYTSNIDMLVPNCTVVVDPTSKEHSLSVDSFTVKNGESRSGTATLPEKVRIAFQTVNNYGNEVACEIQGVINWNRGNENSQVTSAKLTVKDKEKTFSNCKFTITGKVYKTEFAEANGLGTTEVYDSSLSKVTVSGVGLYKDGKCYRECNKATAITRSSITLNDEASFEKITESASTINISMAGYLMTLSSVSSISTDTESNSVRTAFALPSTKDGTASYKLWKKTQTKSGYGNEIAVDSGGNIQVDNAKLSKYDTESNGQTLKAYTSNGTLVKFNLADTKTYYQNTDLADQKIYSGILTNTDYNKVREVTITYSKDVYYNEKTYTEVWDEGSGHYDAGITTGVPKSGTLYTEQGSTNISAGKRMITINDNTYYMAKPSKEDDINKDNTELSDNTIRGKTDTARLYTTEIKGDISKTVTFTD